MSRDVPNGILDWALELITGDGVAHPIKVELTTAPPKTLNRGDTLAWPTAQLEGFTVHRSGQPPEDPTRGRITASGGWCAPPEAYDPTYPPEDTGSTTMAGGDRPAPPSYVQYHLDSPVNVTVGGDGHRLSPAERLTAAEDAIRRLVVPPSELWRLAAIRAEGRSISVTYELVDDA